MDIRGYWRLLRRRAWIPLVLVAISVLAATALAFLTKPQYAATAMVATTGDSRLTFPEVVGSNSLALRVIQDLNSGQSADQVRSRIRVSFSRNNLFRLSVTDPDPQRAVALANTAAKDAAALYQEVAVSGQKTAADPQKSSTVYLNLYLAAAKALLAFNRDHPEAATITTTSRPKDVGIAAQALSLQLDERAAANAYLSFQSELTHSNIQQIVSQGAAAATVVDQAAAQPDTGSRMQMVLYAGALALILGIGLIFVLEYFDNSVRVPEQVEELIGTPVIGVIPRGTARTLRQARGGAA
jgi:capsular polysaccharide biosynthesis protein